MSYLQYYEDENARHPLFHKTRCSKEEALEAIKRLWVKFAGRKALVRFGYTLNRTPMRHPRVKFTSGRRHSHASVASITLNVDFLNWLLVCHELAHSLDELREKQGRRSSEKRWHSKYHEAWVNRLVAYVEGEGWHTGNLAHELALREGAQLERAREAAKPPSPDERIEARRAQVMGLDAKLRKLASRAKALETRKRNALRSLRMLERLHRTTP